PETGRTAPATWSGLTTKATDQGYLNGRAPPGHDLDQTDVGLMMRSATSAAAEVSPRLTIIEADDALIDLAPEPLPPAKAPKPRAREQPGEVEEEPPQPAVMAPKAEPTLPSGIRASGLQAASAPHPPATPAKSAQSAAAALARIEALSAEEKIALFS